MKQLSDDRKLRLKQLGRLQRNLARYPLTPTLKATLACLIAHAEADNLLAWPSYRVLVKELGLSVYTVKRNVHDLKDLGLIKVWTMTRKQVVCYAQKYLSVDGIEPRVRKAGGKLTYFEIVLTDNPILEDWRHPTPASLVTKPRRACKFTTDHGLPPELMDSTIECDRSNRSPVNQTKQHDTSTSFTGERSKYPNRSQVNGGTWSSNEASREVTYAPPLDASFKERPEPSSLATANNQEQGSIAAINKTNHPPTCKTSGMTKKASPLPTLEVQITEEPSHTAKHSKRKEEAKESPTNPAEFQKFHQEIKQLCPDTDRHLGRLIEQWNDPALNLPARWDQVITTLLNSDWYMGITPDNTGGKNQRQIAWLLNPHSDNANDPRAKPRWCRIVEGDAIVLRADPRDETLSSRIKSLSREPGQTYLQAFTAQRESNPYLFLSALRNQWLERIAIELDSKSEPQASPRLPNPDSEGLHPALREAFEENRPTQTGTIEDLLAEFLQTTVQT